MLKSSSAFIGAIVLVVLAFVLNPSPDAHREKIKSAMAERNPVAGLLGIGALTAFVSSYRSIGVASYTKVDDRLVTVGMYGMVFLLGGE